MSPPTAGKVLIICIGNDMVADDAVGHEIHRRLHEKTLPHGARLEFAGVGGISLLDLLEGDEAAMIVVDAVQFGSPPGTIHCLSWEEMPANGGAAVSAHGIGIKEAIEVGRVLYPDRIPHHILLIGVEGRCFNRPRHAMTAAVAESVDKALSAIYAQLQMIQKGADHEKDQALC